MTASPMMSQAAAQAALNAITALLNSGHIKVWTGSMPATCETADSGTLLATLAFSSTAFGSATTDTGSNGLAKAVANAITSATAGNTGTAGYFRAYSSGGTCEIQGNVGTSSADFVINSTTITSGDTVACTAYTLKLPDGSGAD